MLRFGLLGRKLGHSFSPAIHAMLGDYEYKLYEKEPEELDEFLATTDLDGFNVTIPYKIDVMRSCAELSDRAQAIGCVNTMTRRPDGKWRGDNTDWDGFSYLLGPDADGLRGKPALVLGSGGASRTVCAVLKARGIPYTVISRSGPDNYENLEKHYDAELIVNATPVGMYPDNGKSPLDLAPFKKLRLVLDLIYNPSRTALLLQADELQVTARGGLLMLVAQGVRAGERFLGRDFSLGTIGHIFTKLEHQTKNIVLIGMPGCGKTTTAAELGRITDRPIYDADDVIVQREGVTIPEIFARGGESEFRRIETAVMADLGKLSGVVIACGGGVVTQPPNLPLIRQNSYCIYLDRDGDLPTEGRPVSQRDGLAKLRAIRLPLYNSWGQIKLAAPSAREAAMMIADIFEVPVKLDAE